MKLSADKINYTYGDDNFYRLDTTDSGFGDINDKFRRVLERKDALKIPHECCLIDGTSHRWRQEWTSSSWNGGGGIRNRRPD